VSEPRRPLRIALIGSRGIPARYGGYETLMEQLAPRLRALGHRPTVYCRSHYTARGEAGPEGVALVVQPTLRTKHLDTPVHTLLSCLHAMRARYDAALVVNAANAAFVPLLRLAGTPTALHVDGIERRRAKWGGFGRTVYAVSERLACRLPDAIVTDAAVIRDHYQRRYAARSRLITYGVDGAPTGETSELRRLGLEPRGYLLYVSRFEPENNPHRVAAAYRAVSGTAPLVMVGDAPYASRFIAELRRGADPRVRFPGAIYGEGYRQLMSHALAYVHATEVGGTHPALVTAMGYGNCVLANDTPENREVVGDAGLAFAASEPGSLAAALERALGDAALRSRLGAMAAERARERYSWDAVARQYAELFEELTAGAG
jgi:glycosyltransferase involved in cell wall biosynthesis